MVAASEALVMLFCPPPGEPKYLGLTLYLEQRWLNASFSFGPDVEVADPLNQLDLNLSGTSIGQEVGEAIQEIIDRAGELFSVTVKMPIRYTSNNLERVAPAVPLREAKVDIDYELVFRSYYDESEQCWTYTYIKKEE